MDAPGTALRGQNTTAGGRCGFNRSMQHTKGFASLRGEVRCSHSLRAAVPAARGPSSGNSLAGGSFATAAKWPAVWASRPRPTPAAPATWNSVSEGGQPAMPVADGEARLELAAPAAPQPAQPQAQSALCRRGKRLRRIGIVARARRLAIALWRYLEHGEIPAGAILKPREVNTVRA